MVTMHNKYNLEEHERDVEDKLISQEREQKLEIEEVNEITAQSTTALSRVDDIWVLSLNLFGKCTKLYMLSSHYKLYKSKQITIR